MVTLTDAAAAKAAALLRVESMEGLRLRLAVQPGGCSGLRYKLYFDNRSLEGDEEVELETPEGPLGVVVDRMSSPYLSGAVVDFVDTIEKQGFAIDNPNAAGSCACGDSFH